MGVSAWKQSSDSVGWYCYILPLVFQSTIYGLAIVGLLALSVSTSETLDVRWQLTGEHYRTLLTTPVYYTAFARSFVFCMCVAVLAVLLAVPIAHAMAFYMRASARTVTMYLLFVPFLTNYIVRMFSWQTWLSETGVLRSINELCGGYFSIPPTLNTRIGAAVGLLSVLVPLATLMIYLSLVRLDRTLVLAARNLGASFWATRWHVVLPVMMPGLIVSFFSCFILTFADFTCVRVLGGNSFGTASSLLADRIKIQDWGGATAMATFVLILCLTLLMLAVLLLRRCR